MRACDFAILVWELPNGVVRLANDAASALFGVPVASLAGSRAADFIKPADAVTRTLAVLGSGLFDAVGGERVIHTATDTDVLVRTWTRVIPLHDARVGVSLYVPVEELGRLGRDPFVRWRDLAPVAVGTTARAWHIRHVSTDIRDMLGTEPAELAGSSLLDLVHPDDRWEVVGYPESVTAPHFEHGIRFRHQDGSWVDACVLLAPLADHGADEFAFALIAMPRAPLRGSLERLAELELRLRHIGAEVRAAGVLEDIGTLSAPSTHPALRDLTSRQWEILSRLTRGERVPTIAEALFVSQSTVRNHLSGIYAKFGVHSQAELLAKLHPPVSRA